MMNSSKTRYFNLFYADVDENIIEQIAAEVDGMYERVIRLFELEETAAGFDFYLCPDAEAFKRYAMKSDEAYQPWMVGNADYGNRRISVLSPRAVQDRSYEDMMKVIRHEMAHIALCALADPDEVSICVAEGIAVALAEQIDLSCLNPDGCPTYADLLDEAYFYENNGYSYSGAYMLYFLRRYGIDAFKAIYSGKAKIGQYLFDGFEKAAISDLISDR